MKKHEKVKLVKGEKWVITYVQTLIVSLCHRKTLKRASLRDQLAL